MTKILPIVLFGEVLFDQFPNNLKILGGAPFNVAWHLQAFGQTAKFISRVGEDPGGKLIRQTMQNWGMPTDFVQNDSVYPTGSVQITIENNTASYSILPVQAYDYIQTPDITNIGTETILYHGTLATRSPVSRKTINLIKEQYFCRIFLDVNLRPPWWHKSDVIAYMKDANWVKMNLDELNLLYGKTSNIRSSMEDILSEYKLDGIFVTCAEEGALALTCDNQFVSITPSLLTSDVIDTVGAGDAFSSVLLIGLISNWDLELNMSRAQAFAYAITQQQGATVSNLGFYQHFLNIWCL